MTPAFPKRGPDAGTMDRVRPQCGSWHRPRYRRLADLSSQTPSGGGLSADPGQKQDPGERMLASEEEGLTNQGPLYRSPHEHSDIRVIAAVPGFCWDAWAACSL